MATFRDRVRGLSALLRAKGPPRQHGPWTALRDVSWEPATGAYDAPCGLTLRPVTESADVGFLVAAYPGRRRSGPGAAAEMSERARDGHLQVYAIMDGAMPRGYVRLVPGRDGLSVERAGLACDAGAKPACQRAVDAFVASLVPAIPGLGIA